MKSIVTFFFLLVSLLSVCQIDTFYIYAYPEVPRTYHSFHNYDSLDLEVHVDMLEKVAQKNQHIIQLSECHACSEDAYLDSPPLPFSKQKDSLEIINKSAYFLNSYFFMIAQNLRYPLKALEKGVSEIIWVEFTINNQGEVRFPRIVSGKNRYLRNEALRLIKLIPSVSISFRFTFPPKANSVSIDILSAAS